MSAIWVKDPQDTCWFEFDWSDFLVPGETIVSYSTLADVNLTKLTDSLTDTTVLIQVSGGQLLVPSVLSCNIRTSGSNVYETEKTVYLRARQS